MFITWVIKQYRPHKQAIMPFSVSLPRWVNRGQNFILVYMPVDASDGMGWDQKQVHAGTASQPFMTSSFVPADFVEQLLSSNFTVAHVQTSLSTPALYLRHWHCFSAFLPLFPTIIVCNQIWWTAQPDLDLATWSQLYEYRELGAKLWRTVMHIYRVYSKRDIRRK